METAEKREWGKRVGCHIDRAGRMLQCSPCFLFISTLIALSLTLMPACVSRPPTLFCVLFAGPVAQSLPPSLLFHPMSPLFSNRSSRLLQSHCALFTSDRSSLSSPQPSLSARFLPLLPFPSLAYMCSPSVFDTLPFSSCVHSNFLYQKQQFYKIVSAVLEHISYGKGSSQENDWQEGQGPKCA